MSSQHQRCLEYLKYRYGDSKFVSFIEEGKSGKDTNRPEFQKMVDGILAGKIHVVICTELSRVSRSVIDFHNFINLCNKHEVAFVSLREQFDTSISHGKLMLSILASFAQFEREQISERTSANMQARARRGLYNGGRIFGYRPRLGQKGYLDPDLQEAFLVKLMFEKYLEVGSYCFVANWLNERGYRTRAGRKWSRNSVVQILKNPVYIGKKRLKDCVVNGTWESVVAEPLWSSVQALLDRNCKSRGNVMAKSQHHYLFSGILRCSKCQSAFENSAGTNHQGVRYFYYRHKKVDGCESKGYHPASKIENYICSKIISVVNDNELIEMVSRNVSALAMEESKKLECQLSFLEEQIANLNEEAGKILQASSYLEAEEVQEFIKPRMQKLNERLQALKISKEEVENQLYHVKDKVFSPEDIKKTLEEFSRDFDKLTDVEKKKLVQLLVAKIEVHPDRFIVWMRGVGSSVLNNCPDRVSKRTFLYSVRRYA